MYVVAIVVAIIGGIAVWYGRFKMMNEVADDVTDVVGRVRSRYRMGKFKKKAEGSVLTSANENPDVRHLSEAAVRQQIAPIVAASELDEIIAYAQWATRDLADPLDVVRRFKPLWRDKLTRREREQLVEMGKAMIDLGDDPEHGQTLSLEALRSAIVH